MEYPMSYVHVSRSRGVGIADYEEIARELGSAPIAGQNSHHVGLDGGALVIVEVWDSRADADRFTAERLFPAFERAGVRPDPSIDITAFDAIITGARA
jgi:hypothetical protein